MRGGVRLRLRLRLRLPEPSRGEVAVLVPIIVPAQCAYVVDYGRLTYAGDAPDDETALIFVWFVDVSGKRWINFQSGCFIFVWCVDVSGKRWIDFQSGWLRIAIKFCTQRLCWRQKEHVRTELAVAVA